MKSARLRLSRVLLISQLSLFFQCASKKNQLKRKETCPTFDSDDDKTKSRTNEGEEKREKRKEKDRRQTNKQDKTNIVIGLTSNQCQLSMRRTTFVRSFFVIR